MNIILLGPPGVGKGTQGDLLAAHLGIPKISTGDLLRTAVRDGTELGRNAQSYMDQGLLVPDGIILGLIKQVLESEEASGGGVLMDGFPRTVAQAEAVGDLLAERRTQVDHVVCLEAPSAELIARLLGRAKLQGRSDDNEESISRRLDVYAEQTAPLISYYQDRGLVRKVDGLGSIDEISQRVLRALEY